MDEDNINFWRKDFENSSFYKTYSKNVFDVHHEFHPTDNSAYDKYEFFINAFYPCIQFSHDPKYKFESIQVWDELNTKQNIKEFPLTAEGINDAVNCLFEIVSKKPETDKSSINYWKEKFMSTPFFQKNFCYAKQTILSDESDLKSFTVGHITFRIFQSKKFGSNLWVFRIKKSEEDFAVTKLEEQYFPLTDEGFDEALAHMIKLNEEE